MFLLPAVEFCKCLLPVGLYPSPVNNVYIYIYIYIFFFFFLLNICIYFFLFFFLLYSDIFMLQSMRFKYICKSFECLEI